MKKISSYITALAIGALALQSCSDNWEQPAFAVPKFPTGLEANTTIADLKAAYWQDTESYGTKVGLLENGDSIIIVGTIMSTTTPGNIYKALYVQDETGGICIGIDTTAVSVAYPMGVAMAINCTGLQIGRYSGMMQMGTADGTGVNRITMPELRPHVHIDYFLGNPDTTLTTIPELNEAMKTTEGKIKWQGKMIRINNVKFAEAGQPFTNGSTTSRYIVDDEGNRMIVYNSSYSDFAYDELPYGHGDIAGILSCYRSSWQILLNDTDGCIDFDGEGKPEGPVETIEPAGEGTAADPYNVAKAVQLVTSGNAPATEVYVKGIISEISEIDPSYGNATYDIVDAVGLRSLKVYRGYWLDGAKFTSTDQLEVGKEVVVYGKIENYNNSTPEMLQGNRLISYDGQGGSEPETPSITGTPAGEGTLESPYNVAKALEIITSGQATEDEVYVQGTITGITEIDTGTYGNATYDINDGEGTTSMTIFRGYWLEGAKFTSSDQLKVGEDIVVRGKLIYYNNKTPEMAQGNQVISYGSQSTPQ